MKRILMSISAIVLVAASGWANVHCPDVENQLSNCGFDTDLSDWTVTIGLGSHQPGDDSDGLPGSGSAEIFWSGDQVEIRQCIDTPLAGSIMLGTDAKLVAGDPAPSCWVQIIAFDGPGCTGALTFLGGSLDITGAWETTSFTEAVPGGTQSGLFYIGCVSFAEYTVRFDDAFVIPFDDRRGIPTTGALGIAALVALVSLTGIAALRRRSARRNGLHSSSAS